MRDYLLLAIPAAWQLQVRPWPSTALRQDRSDSPQWLIFKEAGKELNWACGPG